MSGLDEKGNDFITQLHVPGDVGINFVLRFGLNLISLASAAVSLETHRNSLDEGLKPVNRTLTRFLDGRPL